MNRALEDKAYDLAYGDQSGSVEAHTAATALALLALTDQVRRVGDTLARLAAAQGVDL